jgi:hypothetical protein
MWPSSRGIKIIGHIGIALENQMILMPAIQILALSRCVWYTKNGRKEKPREGNTSGNIRGREANTFDQVYDWFHLTPRFLLAHCQLQFIMPVCLYFSYPSLLSAAQSAVIFLSVDIVTPTASLIGGFAPCRKGQR